MGERGMQIKADLNKEGWESSDFPLVCETCLGDNPYVRMTKEPAGKACKICDRPFTIFRWRPGAKARFKKTEVCQTCAKMKNVCQTCVLDLTYGLPVQVRDSVLAEAAAAGEGGAASYAMTVPQSDTNKQWFAGQHDRMVAEGHADSYGKAQINEKLMRLSRAQPYYKRNLPHKCTFYAKGECTRGDRCPFLHEMPTSRSDPLANQNIKDRFYGQDDPVAQKMLGRAASKEKEDQAPLIPPTDPEIKTLMVGGMEGGAVTETEMREAFYGFGEVAGVRMVPAKHLAFVEYTTREAAEAAAKALHNNLTLQGLRLRVSWALRPAGSGPFNPGTGTGSFASAGGAGPLGAPPDFANQPVSTMAGQSLPLPPPQPLNFPPGPSPSSWVPGSNTLPPPGGYPPPGPHPGQGGVRGPPSLPPPQQPYYPSMDPQRMGARLPPQNQAASSGPRDR
ncbi:zinc finger ccch domain-containing protein [Nannochloropsis gaditana]|uniref:Zinc finger ccch domain-containing protein n=1 Tax=Nannochloropsis gaditana TaxID=72520 RepID=W7TN65_9STRA|nr:zinc finger ccch domain-containing protein [Nannochloropsis gaditana]